jgi:predicted N-formylglutamate amidohydrolase
VAGIGEGAAGAVAVENGEGRGGFVLVCDHASNRLPVRLGALGLDAPSLESHIAWDPGALGVARALSRRLDAPLLFSTVSRLIIDCNRPLDAPDLVAATSETTAIPGNADLDPGERARRIQEVYEPYHAAISRCLNGRAARGLPTAVLAVHSFTPVYKGVARPWHVGILFDRDRGLAELLIEGLRAERGLNVGVNEPYSPADRVYSTLSRHAEARGLRSAMIEIRNDGIGDAEGQALWADRLAGLLEAAEPALRAGGGQAVQTRKRRGAHG